MCIPVCREPEPAENHLKDMLQQLNTIIAAKPSEKAVIHQGECRFFSCVDKESTLFCIRCIQSFCSVFVFAEEAEDPACIPIFWISKWVDYSDKYGLGKN